MQSLGVQEPPLTLRFAHLKYLTPLTVLHIAKTSAASLFLNHLSPCQRLAEAVANVCKACPA